MKYINNRHLIIIKNVIHKKNKIIVNLGIIGRDDIELFRIIFLPFFPPLFTFCVSALRIKRTMFTIFFINEYKLKIMNIYFFRFTFFSSFFFFHEIRQMMSLKVSIKSEKREPFSYFLSFFRFACVFRRLLLSHSPCMQPLSPTPLAGCLTQRNQRSAKSATRINQDCFFFHVAVGSRGKEGTQK